MTESRVLYKHAHSLESPIKAGLDEHLWSKFQKLRDAEKHPAVLSSAETLRRLLYLTIALDVR